VSDWLLAHPRKSCRKGTMGKERKVGGGNKSWEKYHPWKEDCGKGRSGSVIKTKAGSEHDFGNKKPHISEKRHLAQ